MKVKENKGKEEKRRRDTTERNNLKVLWKKIHWDSSGLQLGQRRDYVHTCKQQVIRLWLPGNSIKRVRSISAGARGSVVVKVLCCKPEVRGFKSR
jgi:hypothetical protein